MDRQQMMFRMGFGLMLLAGALFCTWGYSAAHLVQGWSPISSETIEIAFGYLAVIFRVPTLASLFLGCLFLAVALGKAK